MNLPQLWRDLRDVDEQLGQARSRLAQYERLTEHELATDARRVVAGHEQLRARLSARILALTSPSTSSFPTSPCPTPLPPLSPS